MKPYINLLVVVVAAAILYMIYGMAMFKPDEPRNFVFNEPNIPPELIFQDEEKITDDVDGKLDMVAVETAQKALGFYREAQSNAPQQVNDTLSLILDKMTSSDLPLYFLSFPNPQKAGMRTFETLRMPMDSVIDPSKSKQSLNCTSKMPVANIVFGTSGKDVIVCDAVRDVMGTGIDPDFIFIGGPENDQITDTPGNRIVNGGTGNDVLNLAAGRTIVLLDSSWGKDTLTIDCVGAFIDTSQIPTGFPIPWLSKTTNFIVLGRSINPADVYWNGNVLTHKATGDTLTVNQNCFTVVPAIPE